MDLAPDFRDLLAEFVAEAAAAARCRFSGLLSRTKFCRNVIAPGSLAA